MTALMFPRQFDKVIVADTDWVRLPAVHAALKDCAPECIAMDCESGPQLEGVAQDVIKEVRSGKRLLLAMNAFVGLKGMYGVDGVFPRIAQISRAQRGPVRTVLMSCLDYGEIQEILAEENIPRGDWEYVHIAVDSDRLHSFDADVCAKMATLLGMQAAVPQDL